MTPTETTAEASESPKPWSKPLWYLWTYMVLSLTGATMSWVLMLVRHPVLGTLNVAVLVAAWVLDFVWTLRMVQADHAAGLVDDKQRFWAIMEAVGLLTVTLACGVALVALGWTLGPPPPTTIR